MKNLLITLCLFLSVGTLMAQTEATGTTVTTEYLEVVDDTDVIQNTEYEYEEKRGSKWAVGLHLGLSNSDTDTHSIGRHGGALFSQANLAYGLNAKYLLSQRFAVRADYFGTKISGDDREIDGPCSDGEDIDVVEIGCHRDRAWKFDSPLHELSLSFEWDIFGKGRYPEFEYYNQDGERLNEEDVNLAYGTYYNEDGDVYNFNELKRFKRKLSPYIGLGIAMTFVNPNPVYPTLEEFGTVPDAADVLADSLEQGSMYMHFPITLGLRYDLSERFFLDGELRGVFQATDLLDGMKNTTNFDDDRNHGDTYQFATLRVGYRLGIKEDRDFDGVSDDDDICPDVPGLKELDGCPDRDGDGITDEIDACPDVRGLRKFAGCPDTDGDGIQDLLDLCPELPGSMAGKGCPDRDGDGVTDEKDICPNLFGLDIFGGCPDTDGDSIPDNEDACPRVKGSDEFHGCNEDYPSLEYDGRFTNSARAAYCEKVYFESGSSNTDFAKSLQSSSVNLQVQNLTDKLKSNNDYILVIGGHTDTDGEAKFNQDLSEKRAREVARLFQAKGISSSKLVTVGYGEYFLADYAELTDDGKALNRRVEMCVFDKNIQVEEKKEREDYEQIKQKAIEERLAREANKMQTTTKKVDASKKVQSTTNKVKSKVNTTKSKAQTKAKSTTTTTRTTSTTNSSSQGSVSKTVNLGGIIGDAGKVEEVNRVFADAMYGIKFDSSKSSFKQKSYAAMDDVVRVLKNYPELNLEIGGHTDSMGEDDANLRLSMDRATAVKTYLVSKGIDANRLTSKGYGEINPISDNSTAIGRAKNRRVVFTVLN